MLDSVVDVRLLIVDPEKAQSLLQHQGALLVNQEVLKLSLISNIVVHIFPGR